MKALAVTALLTACGAQLTTASNNPQVDASTSGVDARGGTRGDAASGVDAPMQSACASGRKLYLAFEGVTLTHAATDATQNTAAWIGVTTASVPAFHPGLTN